MPSLRYCPEKTWLERHFPPLLKQYIQSSGLLLVIRGVGLLSYSGGREELSVLVPTGVGVPMSTCLTLRDKKLLQKKMLKPLVENLVGFMDVIQAELLRLVSVISRKIEDILTIIQLLYQRRYHFGSGLLTEKKNKRNGLT
ncbi:MAG: hypothetical protein COC10_13265 [Sphingobium sp.]|nr:MAG: hypothetical protein COC10_13265 [Sphingobium sp.]